ARRLSIARAWMRSQGWFGRARHAGLCYTQRQTQACSTMAAGRREGAQMGWFRRSDDQNASGGGGGGGGGPVAAEDTQALDAYSRSVIAVVKQGGPAGGEGGVTKGGAGRGGGGGGRRRRGPGAGSGVIRTPDGHRLANR